MRSIAPRAGLVGAGGIGQSFIGRFPTLLAAIGPVKATSFRVARRIVNALHAGHAVEGYGALGGCASIWISVPESSVERVVRDLAAQTPLEKTVVVLAGSIRESDGLKPLAAHGAYVATLNSIDADGWVLMAEGHPEALRELERFAAAEKRKLIEISRGAKPLYLAGVYLATHLTLPWISASVESLRAAGFSRADATSVAATLASRTLRSYAKAGRKAWNRTAAHDLRMAMESIATIRAADSNLASIYASGIEQALKYFS